MRRRVEVIIVAGAATIAALVMPLPASVEQSFDEAAIVREVGYIPMKDGVRLAYVAYRPKREGRFPVLITYDPYGSSGMLSSDRGPRKMLQNGYAVLGVNIRGSGCSEGAYRLFAPNEGPDGAVVVEWAGTQPWSTGNVGMIGASYPGHTQILVAAQRPPHLKALAAGGLTASIYRDGFRAGGLFNVQYAGNWALHVQPRIARVGSERRIAWGDADCAAIRAKQPPNRTFQDSRAHVFHDEYWESGSLENFAPRVEVPILVVQGWQDHETAISGPPRLFPKLQVPTRIILQNGGHGVYGRDIAQDEVVRWMNRWLKNDRNGIEKEPQVTIWWETRDEGNQPGSPLRKATPNWTSTFSQWPPAETTWETLYLTADGRMTSAVPDGPAQVGQRDYLFPVGTELAGSNLQFALTPFATGSLAYRGEPVREDTAILGGSLLTFYASAEQHDTDFLFVLHDRAPNGDTLYLQRAYLRASMRAIDPKRAVAQDVFHPFAKAQPLTPGQVHEFKVAIPPVGHVLRRGHALELMVLAPSTIPNPTWSPQPLELPGVNTVYHSPKYPSHLKIPIIPGLKAEAPPPPCGSLENQPCRFAAPATTSSGSGR